MFDPLSKLKVKNTLYSFVNNTAWKYLRKVLTSRFTFSTNSEAKNTLLRRWTEQKKIRQGPA